MSRFWRMAVVGLFLALGGIACSGESSVKPNNTGTFSEASTNQKSNKKELETTIQDSGGAEQKPPPEEESGNFEDHFQLARKYAKEKDLENALIECEIADKIKPNTARVQNLFGILSWWNGEIEDSLKYIRTAMSLDPKKLEYVTNYFLVCEKNGLFDNAIAELRTRLNENEVPHRKAILYYFIGGLFSKKNDPINAASSFKEAAKHATDKGIKTCALRGMALANRDLVEYIKRTKEILEMDIKEYAQSILVIPEDLLLIQLRKGYFEFIRLSYLNNNAGPSKVFRHLTMEDTDYTYKIYKMYSGRDNKRLEDYGNIVDVTLLGHFICSHHLKKESIKGLSAREIMWRRRQAKRYLEIASENYPKSRYQREYGDFENYVNFVRRFYVKKK